MVSLSNHEGYWSLVRHSSRSIHGPVKRWASRFAG
jgi:hypothetical protein